MAAEDGEGHSGYADPPGFRLVGSDRIGVLVAGEHFLDPVPGNAETARGIGDDRVVEGVGLAAEERSLEHVKQPIGEAQGAREVEGAVDVEAVGDHAVDREGKSLALGEASADSPAGWAGREADMVISVSSR